jgi:O-methyltransferase
MSAVTPSAIALRERYVDLLMGCLTRELFLEEEAIDVDLHQWPGDTDELRSTLRERGWRLTRRGGDATDRDTGHDWPPTAETMVGHRRLTDVRRCVATVLDDEVPGDFVETGVWRGGVTILMRGMLEAWGDPDRRVWVADSFCGLPAPDAETYPQDVGHDMSGVPTLAVPVERVRANFERYGLLDDRVCFLEGWFKDTLPTAPMERLAILRLDGDMYESTTDALTALEPRVSRGGYVIVDDYGAWENCRAAVDDYRAAQGITDELVTVDWTGVHWRKTTEART